MCAISLPMTERSATALGQLIAVWPSLQEFGLQQTPDPKGGKTAGWYSRKDVLLFRSFFQIQSTTFSRHVRRIGISWREVEALRCR